MPNETRILECVGCGRFRAMVPAPAGELPVCATCRHEGELGRVWDPWARRYVAIGSGHDYHEGYDDDSDGWASDTCGRL